MMKNDNIPSSSLIMRSCYYCEISLTDEKFSKEVASKIVCKKCNSFRGIIYKEKTRKGHFSSWNCTKDSPVMHNMIDQWNKMNLDSVNECQACSRKEVPKESLHTDHLHESNTIRGRLCQFCNRALGHMFDKPLVGLQLVLYLLNCDRNDKLGQRALDAKGLQDLHKLLESIQEAALNISVIRHIKFEDEGLSEKGNYYNDTGYQADTENELNSVEENILTANGTDKKFTELVGDDDYNSVVKNDEAFETDKQVACIFYDENADQSNGSSRSEIGCNELSNAASDVCGEDSDGSVGSFLSAVSGEGNEGVESVSCHVDHIYEIRTLNAPIHSPSLWDIQDFASAYHLISAIVSESSSFVTSFAKMAYCAVSGNDVENCESDNCKDDSGDGKICAMKGR